MREDLKNDKNIVPPQYKGLSSDIVDMLWDVPYFVDEKKTIAEKERKVLALEYLRNQEQQKKQKEVLEQKLQQEEPKEILTSKEEIKKHLDDLYQQGYRFLTHQTASDVAEKINQEGFAITGGYSGTTLLGSPESIMNQIESIDTGHGHRGSDAMVIMMFDKETFGPCRQPDDYSDTLIDQGIYQKTPLQYHLGYYDMKKGLVVNKR